MTVRRRSIALATAAAALMIPAAAGTSHAAVPKSEVYLTTPFSKVVAGWQWRNDRLDPVMMSVQDTNADGYAVSIRLITESAGEGRHKWTTHMVTSGAGTGLNLTTYAVTNGTPLRAWVETCKWKGGSPADCRISRITTNPIDDSSVSG
ncbi:hypothetical protein [Streptomyces vietnamensis]|uniref:Secreted protein n=1 Tax=Streptomyces vietnamensis TaxID=362257 RepID=A0A0B5HZ03_9ACTN|nr:hypothetical protein [Streptomyces vietnamensis]AJF65611.1 hypothetical protein SVTN_15540 [Streptomyces vietnamensis]